jgi:uncharacterized protein YjbJ (UPF0337 family)
MGIQTCVGSPPDLISHVESVRVALWSLARGGNAEITDDTSACFSSRFGMLPGPRPEMVNSAQTSNSREITKVAAEVRQHRTLQAPRRNMKPSMKDKIKGSFHEVKGTIKEEVGKVTNDRNLKAKGKAEKKAAEVQQRIGRAKDTVAKLKRKLKELKTA